jgi:hypothetical protein
MNLTKNTIYLLALLFFASACDNNEVTPQTGSVLILHEGGFGNSNATIGQYDPILNSYSPSAFREVNGSFIGDVQQSGVRENNSLYSVLNGSNSVVKTNINSLEITATIEGELIDKPRDMEIQGNMGYISNWGPYGENFNLTDSRILLVNLSDNSITGSIAMQPGVEDVQIVENKLLVVRYFFGSYNNLTFINLGNNEVENDIELPSGPEEILLDANGSPWVVCNSGSLVNINVAGNSIAEAIDLAGEIYGDADVYQNEIYFLQNNEVKKANIGSGQITSLFNTVEIETPYAFAVDPNSGEIYIGDGVDFSDGGTVYRYSATGELLDSFVSGILPTQFIFN